MTTNNDTRHQDAFDPSNLPQLFYTSESHVEYCNINPSTEYNITENKIGGPLEMTDPKDSRIAIRFGASSSSKPTSGNSSRSTPSSTLGKRYRPRFDHHDDNESSADDEPEEAQVESITHFSANGAEFVDEVTNRHKSGGGRSSSPRRDRSPDIKIENRNEGPNRDANAKEEEEESIKYGLTISKKSEQSGIKKEEDAKDDVSRETKTIDEEAIDALMGKDAGRQRKSRTEDGAYRDAAANAPKEDSLETYDAIPVEGFGASLLMGQGWDGKMRGPKAKEITRRPDGMGLGSKKLSGMEDLGAWDSKGKSRSDKRPRLDEYRRNRDKERDRREDRYRDSYKNERDRERDRDRNGDRNGDRTRDNGRDRDRHRDRESDHYSRSDRDYRR